MDINISAKHVEVEEELKEKAKQLSQKLADDFPNQKITSVRVLFGAERAWRPVEVLVNAKNLTLHAAAKSDVQGASLVNAFEKINTQMGRFLDKLQQSSVKADPKTKDKIWRASDLRTAEDDADLQGYEYEYSEE